MHHGRFVLSIAIAACGGGHASPPSPDAASSPDALPASATITVTAETTPKLILFRDGLTASWQPPASSAAGTYTFDVHGPYDLIVVCEDDSAGFPDIMSWQTGGTLADPVSYEAPCFAPITTPPQVDVTGQMVQAGKVALGLSESTSTGASWTFDLTNDPGTYDLIAVADGRIAIQRGLVATSNTALAAPVDVVTHGVALAAMPFTATNAAPGETIDGSSAIYSAGKTLLGIYDGPPAGMMLLPASVLVPGDEQSVDLFATDGGLRSRQIERSYSAGDPTSLALPAPIGDVQFAASPQHLVATMQALPDADIVALSASSFLSSPQQSLDVERDMSRSYIAQTHATSISVDTDVPGFLAAWRVDYQQAYMRDLSSETVTDTSFADAQYLENVNGNFAPRRASRSRAGGASPMHRGARWAAGGRWAR